MEVYGRIKSEHRKQTVEGSLPAASSSAQPGLQSPRAAAPASAPSGSEGLRSAAKRPVEDPYDELSAEWTTTYFGKLPASKRPREAASSSGDQQSANKQSSASSSTKSEIKREHAEPAVVYASDQVPGDGIALIEFFAGLRTARLVLRQLGANVQAHLSAEMDKYANFVSAKAFAEPREQLYLDVQLVTNETLQQWVKELYAMQSVRTVILVVGWP